MPRPAPGQLPLFADLGAVDPVAVDEDTRRLAAALPGAIRLGTSSWSFPGWTGIVYAAHDGRAPTEQELARHGLAAYAAHPLFRTVSLDRTFYAPLAAAEFAAYAAQVPAGFRFVVKAPAAFTDPVVRRPGSAAPARDNPSFLDAAAATAAFVRPAIAGLGAAAGPLVLQFPPLGRRLLADPRRLAGVIAGFVARLPRGPLLACELRDPELANPEFAAALRDSGAVPCLAVHARMPPVATSSSRSTTRPRAPPRSPSSPWPAGSSRRRKAHLATRRSSTSVAAPSVSVARRRTVRL